MRYATFVFVYSLGLFIIVFCTVIPLTHGHKGTELHNRLPRPERKAAVTDSTVNLTWSFASKACLA